MTDPLSQRIAALKPAQALAAAEALVSLLEPKLPEVGDTTNFEQLVATDSGGARALHATLAKQNPTEAEAAEAARSMLILVTQLGYHEEVQLALDAGSAHGRDFGTLSVPLLIAGLAAVVAFIPKEQRQKVREIEHVQPDGSLRRERESSTETIRVGADAFKALSSWWSNLIT